MMVFAQNRRFFIVLSQAKIAHFWPKPPFSSFFTKETPKNRIFCLLFFNKFSTGFFDQNHFTVTPTLYYQCKEKAILFLNILVRLP